jgi:hypothetical protein
VRRYHAEHEAKSGSPAASPTAKTKTKEGQLFQAQPPKTEGKSGSSAFPARKYTNKSEIKSFQLCFCFSIVLCILVFLPLSSHKKSTL